VSAGNSEVVATVSNVQSTSMDRLDKDAITTVLELTLENMMRCNMLGSFEIGGAQALVTDMSTLMSARTLWRQVLKRSIIDRVHAEVAKRNLLPITIRTLCSLLLLVTKQFE
jgi:hypothetical protein